MYIKGMIRLKLSWIFWWIVSIGELSIFAYLSFLLWMRDVDATGTIQTTEIKWLNILVILAFFAIPFIIQGIWLLANFIISNKSKEVGT